jgi:predicted GNAT family acetyltransferase
VLSTASLRVMDDIDRDAVTALVAQDPLVNVFVGSRVAHGIEPWRLGGELWGWAVGGELESLCFSGANLVPVAAGPEALAAFAGRARRQGRRCSSIVGPQAMVETLWELLEPSWGAARAVRKVQPFMALQSGPLVTPDPLVRRVEVHELDVLLPAAVAMFTEEVGISPLGHDAAAYRARVHDLVAAGRAYARIEDGRVVFKAEIGAVTPLACQLQGVWVAPERRGEGLAAAATAAVVGLAQRDHASVVTLYVNDFNRVARRVYARVGFREIAAFTTVLF